eukprot:tig00021234_g19425.t1
MPIYDWEPASSSVFVWTAAAAAGVPTWWWRSEPSYHELDNVEIISYDDYEIGGGQIAISRGNPSVNVLARYQFSPLAPNNGTLDCAQYVLAAGTDTEVSCTFVPRRGADPIPIDADSINVFINGTLNAITTSFGGFGSSFVFSFIPTRTIYFEDFDSNYAKSSMGMLVGMALIRDGYLALTPRSSSTDAAGIFHLQVPKAPRHFSASWKMRTDSSWAWWCSYGMSFRYGAGTSPNKGIENIEWWYGGGNYIQGPESLLVRFGCGYVIAWLYDPVYKYHMYVSSSWLSYMPDRWSNIEIHIVPHPYGPAGKTTLHVKQDGTTRIWAEFRTWEPKPTWRFSLEADSLWYGTEWGVDDLLIRSNDNWDAPVGSGTIGVYSGFGSFTQLLASKTVVVTNGDASTSGLQCAHTAPWSVSTGAVPADSSVDCTFTPRYMGVPLVVDPGTLFLRINGSLQGRVTSDLQALGDGSFKFSIRPKPSRVLFEEDFSADPATTLRGLKYRSALGGAARINGTGKYLALTPEVANTLGTYTVRPGGSPRYFTISFRYRLKADKGDGISFSYGSNMTVGTTPNDPLIWDQWWDHPLSAAGDGLSVLIRANGWTYVRVFNRMHAKWPRWPQWAWSWYSTYEPPNAPAKWHTITISVTPYIWYRPYWRYGSFYRETAAITVVLDDRTILQNYPLYWWNPPADSILLWGASTGFRANHYYWWYYFYYYARSVPATEHAIDDITFYSYDAADIGQGSIEVRSGQSRTATTLANYTVPTGTPDRSQSSVSCSPVDPGAFTEQTALCTLRIRDASNAPVVIDSDALAFRMNSSLVGHVRAFGGFGSTYEFLVALSNQVFASAFNSSYPVPFGASMAGSARIENGYLYLATLPKTSEEALSGQAGMLIVEAPRAVTYFTVTQTVTSSSWYDGFTFRYGSGLPRGSSMDPVTDWWSWGAGSIDGSYELLIQFRSYWVAMAYRGPRDRWYQWRWGYVHWSFWAYSYRGWRDAKVTVSVMPHETDRTGARLYVSVSGIDALWAELKDWSPRSDWTFSWSAFAPWWWYGGVALSNMSVKSGDRYLNTDIKAAASCREGPFSVLYNNTAFVATSVGQGADETSVLTCGLRGWSASRISLQAAASMDVPRSAMMCSFEPRLDNVPTNGEGRALEITVGGFYRGLVSEILPLNRSSDAPPSFNFTLGISSTRVLYEADFNTSSPSVEWLSRYYRSSMFGSAKVVNGSLRLTEFKEKQQGWFVVSPPVKPRSFEDGPGISLEPSIDAQMKFSWNWWWLANLNAAGNGLSISWMTIWDYIYAYYPAERYRGFAWGGVRPAAGKWMNIRIRVQSDIVRRTWYGRTERYASLKMWRDGKIIMNGVQLPGFNPTSDWNFAVIGDTGLGLYDTYYVGEHWIDDFKIIDLDPIPTNATNTMKLAFASAAGASCTYRELNTTRSLPDSSSVLTVSPSVVSPSALKPTTAQLLPRRAGQSVIMDATSSRVVLTGNLVGSVSDWGDVAADFDFDFFPSPVVFQSDFSLPFIKDFRAALSGHAARSENDGGYLSLTTLLVNQAGMLVFSPAKIPRFQTISFDMLISGASSATAGEGLSFSMGNIPLRANVSELVRRANYGLLYHPGAVLTVRFVVTPADKSIHVYYPGPTLLFRQAFTASTPTRAWRRIVIAIRPAGTNASTSARLSVSVQNTTQINQLLLKNWSPDNLNWTYCLHASTGAQSASADQAVDNLRVETLDAYSYVNQSTDPIGRGHIQVYDNEPAFLVSPPNAFPGFNGTIALRGREMLQPDAVEFVPVGDPANTVPAAKFRFATDVISIPDATNFVPEATVAGVAFGPSALNISGTDFVERLSDSLIVAVAPPPNEELELGNPVDVSVFAMSLANSDLRLPSAFVYNPVIILSSISSERIILPAGPPGVREITLDAFNVIPVDNITLTFKNETGAVTLRAVVVDDDTLSVSLNLAAMAPGMYNVTVESRLSGPGLVNERIHLEIVPPPNLIRAVPADGPVSGGFTVNLTMSSLSTPDPSLAVQVGPYNVTGINEASETLISFDMPRDLANGTYPITVYTSWGAFTFPSAFTLNPVANLSALLVPRPVREAGGVEVTLLGRNFLKPDVTINIELTNEQTYASEKVKNASVIDADRVAFIVPALEEGTYALEFTSARVGSASLPSAIRISKAPNITQFLPANEVANEGGASITIVGENFPFGENVTASVTIGGYAMVNVSIVSRQTIELVFPKGPLQPGTFSLLLNSSSTGSDNFPNVFTILPGARLRIPFLKLA